MPPTPLTASFRIAFKYTVAGLNHRHNSYLEAGASGDPSGYNTVPRPGGFGTVGVSTLADRWFNIVAPLYDPAVTQFTGWELFQRSGTVWLFVSAGNTAVVATGGGGYQAANGMCVSIKSFTNKRIPRYLFEAPFGPAIKISNLAALGGYRALVDYYAGTGVAPNNADYWVWAEDRNKAEPQRFLAVVIDSNQKLRRMRRIT